MEAVSQRRTALTPFACSFSLLFAVLLAGCAGPEAMMQNKWEETSTRHRLSSLSKESYAKAASYIEGWQAGEPPKVTGCNIIERRHGENILAMSVTCNGWVGPLSNGGWPGLGAFVGVSERMVYGSHLYGYLHDDLILVPRYEVILRAERIDKAEYERLRENKEKVGKIRVHLADNPSLAYWKNMSISEVRKLDLEELAFARAKELELSPHERADAFVDFARSHTTRERFEKARKILETIPVGADRWKVIKALGGSFSTWNAGKSYYLAMDGFLNFEDLRISEVTDDGFFKVWPFGYMEQEEALPQLDIIFKNDKVFKLVPHAPEEELRHYFSNP